MDDEQYRDPGESVAANITAWITRRVDRLEEHQDETDRRILELSEQIGDSSRKLSAKIDALPGLIGTRLPAGVKLWHILAAGAGLLILGAWLGPVFVDRLVDLWTKVR